MAISAIVAVGDAGDALVAKLKEKAAQLKIGAGDSRSTARTSTWGRSSRSAHRDKVAGYVDKGVAEGAKLVLDGRDVQGTGRTASFSALRCSTT